MDGTTYHIGEVATRAGLSLRTVRYYEDVGLVAPSGRTEGGFRLYRETDVKRLLLVRALKPTGLSVEELAQLLALHDRATSEELSAVDQDRLAGLLAQARQRLRIERERLIAAELAVEVLAAPAGQLPEAAVREPA
jgi:MerR family transcriptional regulator, copper efflux regulator